MSLSKICKNRHSFVAENNCGEQVLPLPTTEQRIDVLEQIKQEISESYAGVMEICKQANPPTNVRNLINALIKLSQGKITVKVNDFEIANVFYQDESKRDALKKKVQRWRKALDKWQTETGLTLVQIRSGYQTTNPNGSINNEKTEYRLVILDLAAKVYSQGNLNLEWKAQNVLQDLLAQAVPSRLDKIRKNPLTLDRCMNSGTSWIRKTLEIANVNELEEVVGEINENIRHIINEILEKRKASGTDVSHLNFNSETLLNTRSTINTYLLNNKIDHCFGNDIQLDQDINHIENSILFNEDTTDSIENNSLINKPNLGLRIPDKKEASLSMLEQALAHARRGFRVFPVYRLRGGVCTCRYGAECPTPAKHPCILNWNNEATTDEEQIRQWWRKFRHANIGIATGDYTDEHILVVLDLDTKANGFETLELLENEFGKLPKTLTAITGSKGRHFLFLAAKGLDIRNLQASLKLGKGLDIRGLNGFIVAVGSMHASGNRYEWIDENTPIAEMPTWMIDKLTKPLERKAYQPITTGNGSNLTTSFSNSNNIIEVQEYEGRNNFLFVKALHFFRNGYDKQTVEKEIAFVNSKVCKPPLGEIELRKLIDSAEERFPIQR